jgi:hypothetical protein
MFILENLVNPVNNYHRNQWTLFSSLMTSAVFATRCAP